MVVCKRCLEEIESHEGKQVKKECESHDTEVVYGYYDEDGNFVRDDYGPESLVYCEWCDEYHPIEDCYVI